MNDIAYLIRGRTTVVWALLVAATIASWWMGAHAPSLVAEINGGPGVVILAIAFIKIRFVGMYFMELRHAPVALRLIFEGYCVVVFFALAGMLLTA